MGGHGGSPELGDTSYIYLYNIIYIYFHTFPPSISKVGLHVALPAGAVKETESPKSSEDKESSGWDCWGFPSRA